MSRRNIPEKVFESEGGHIKRITKYFPNGRIETVTKLRSNDSRNLVDLDMNELDEDQRNALEEFLRSKNIENLKEDEVKSFLNTITKQAFVKKKNESCFSLNKKHRKTSNLPSLTGLENSKVKAPTVKSIPKLKSDGALAVQTEKTSANSKIDSAYSKIKEAKSIRHSRKSNSKFSNTMQPMDKITSHLLKSSGSNSKPSQKCSNQRSFDSLNIGKTNREDEKSAHGNDIGNNVHDSNIPTKRRQKTGPKSSKN